MLTVETRHAVGPATAGSFDTDALRRHFHVGGIFVPGEIRLIYTHYDRMIVGGAVPGGAALALDRVAEAGTPSLLDRRELVVVNIGGDGSVAAAGETRRGTRRSSTVSRPGAGETSPAPPSSLPRRRRSTSTARSCRSTEAGLPADERIACAHLCRMSYKLVKSAEQTIDHTGGIS